MENRMQPAPGGVVHLSPRDATYVTPCCGQTPFDLARTDRMTNDPSLVTCGGPEPKVAPELPKPAAGVDPASAPYRIEAHAFNAVTRALPDDMFVPLSERQAIAQAVVAAVEPVIRADEREQGARPEPGYVTVSARDVAIALNGYAGFTGDPVSFAGELHERLRRTVFADQPQPAPGPDSQQRYIDQLHDLIRDMCGAYPGLATELPAFQDRAGQLYVHDHDGQPISGSWADSDGPRAAPAEPAIGGAS